MDEPRGQDVLKVLTDNDSISRGTVFSHSGNILAETVDNSGPQELSRHRICKNLYKILLYINSLSNKFWYLALQIAKQEADRIIRFLVSRELAESKRMRVFVVEFAVQWFDYPRSLRCQTNTGEDGFIVWGADEYIFVGWYEIDVHEDDAYAAIETAAETLN